MLAFHVLAIPGSLFWGTGNWELTLGVVLWMAPALLLYVTTDGYKVLAWLAPAFLIHAGMIIYQGFTGWKLIDANLLRLGEPTGLANNPNLAAGFLALGIIYFMTTRYKWLSPPLMMALLFTGSRWGLIVALAVIVLMVGARTISWKPLAVTIVALVVSVVLIGAILKGGYQIAGYGSFTSAATIAREHVNERLAVPHIPSILPSGVAEHPGLHNVPLRISVENGLLAAGIWVGVTLWALTKRRFSVRWWLLLTLAALSLLDYYTWMGHLGGFWWLLVGLLAKRKVSAVDTPNESAITFKDLGKPRGLGGHSPLIRGGHVD